MSETKHTPEPWTAESDYIFADVPDGRPNGEGIAWFARYGSTHKELKETREANARRAALCVNACKGMGPAQLDRAEPGIILEVMTAMVTDVHVLRAALSQLLDVCDRAGSAQTEPDEFFNATELARQVLIQVNPEGKPHE